MSGAGGSEGKETVHIFYPDEYEKMFIAFAHLWGMVSYPPGTADYQSSHRCAHQWAFGSDGKVYVGYLSEFTCAIEFCRLNNLKEAMEEALNAHQAGSPSLRDG